MAVDSTTFVKKVLATKRAALAASASTSKHAYALGVDARSALWS
jgi:hypothetical protein